MLVQHSRPLVELLRRIVFADWSFQGLCTWDSLCFTTVALMTTSLITASFRLPQSFDELVFDASAGVINCFGSY